MLPAVLGGQCSAYNRFVFLTPYTATKVRTRYTALTHNYLRHALTQSSLVCTARILHAPCTNITYMHLCSHLLPHAHTDYQLLSLPHLPFPPGINYFGFRYHASFFAPLSPSLVILFSSASFLPPHSLHLLTLPLLPFLLFHSPLFFSLAAFLFVYTLTAPLRHSPLLRYCKSLPSSFTHLGYYQQQHQQQQQRHRQQQQQQQLTRTPNICHRVRMSNYCSVELLQFTVVCAE